MHNMCDASITEYELKLEFQISTYNNAIVTSSNFWLISENAVTTASLLPVTDTILKRNKKIIQIYKTLHFKEIL